MTIELGLLVIGSPGSTHRTPQAVTPDGGSRALVLEMAATSPFPFSFHLSALSPQLSGVGCSIASHFRSAPHPCLR